MTILLTTGVPAPVSAMLIAAIAKSAKRRVSVRPRLLRLDDVEAFPAGGAGTAPQPMV